MKVKKYLQNKRLVIKILEPNTRFIRIKKSDILKSSLNTIFNQDPAEC